jgi:hypothetical protein
LSAFIGGFGWSDFAGGAAAGAGHFPGGVAEVLPHGVGEFLEPLDYIRVLIGDVVLLADVVLQIE